MNIWSKRESLVNVDNPSSYFFTAVYRRVYHHYRKIALEKKLLRVAPPVKESVNTTEEMVIAHESSELISRAIDKLPPQQQLVFKLCKQERKSREDVAALLTQPFIRFSDRKPIQFGDRVMWKNLRRNEKETKS